MRLGDFIWLAALCAVSSVMVVPSTHEVFVSATKAHPYLMGFVKFGILATMGELLAIRIAAGAWKAPAGIIYRSIIWGLIGIFRKDPDSNKEIDFRWDASYPRP